MLKKSLGCLNLIQDGPFQGFSQMGDGGGGGKNLDGAWSPLPKICHTYATMMKLDRDLT